MEMVNRFMWVATGFFLAYMLHGIYVHNNDLITGNAIGALLSLCVACVLEYNI